MKHKQKSLVVYIIAILIPWVAAKGYGESSAPNGLMLNLDFSNMENGLIPKKALYPLYVPQCDAGIETLLLEYKCWY